MKNWLIFYLIFVATLCSSKIFAQLQSCSGNSGAPIFMETFGEGLINGPEFPFGVTSYEYVDGAPNDGQYTISSSTQYFDWFDVADVTNNDVNGKCLIVNADFSPGEFYRGAVSGLCEETTYEFSSWLINLLPSIGCGGVGIPINVRFEIWDSSDSNLLAFGDTGDIAGTSSPNWQLFALVFQTLPGQTSIILKMLNNGSGGCGNDLAIDDIVFKSCGDFLPVSDELNSDGVELCSNQAPFSTTLTVMPDFSVYETHFYQWQVSTDGNTWSDIPLESDQSLFISTETSILYRVKVAESSVNLDNPQCVSFSDIYQVTINQLPSEPILQCWESLTLDEENCSWVVSGEEPLAPEISCFETATFNSLLCSWEVTGEQPEEPPTLCDETAAFNTVSCQWEITLNLPDPVLESLLFCAGQDIRLSADMDNVTYLWNTGDTTKVITVNQSGIYTVEMIDPEGCRNFKEITLSEFDTPVIDNISSQGNSILITTVAAGNYEYSLDGFVYQSSSLFPIVSGGYYTVYVRDIFGCSVVFADHLHFVIPKFLTPNGDLINDTFDLVGIEYYNSSQVQIFDRYGKLVKSAKNVPFSWDGTFNNQKLPSSDYWYIITIEGQVFNGHFTLKR